MLCAGTATVPSNGVYTPQQYHSFGFETGKYSVLVPRRKPYKNYRLWACQTIRPRKETTGEWRTEIGKWHKHIHRSREVKEPAPILVIFVSVLLKCAKFNEQLIEFIYSHWSTIDETKQCFFPSNLVSNFRCICTLGLRLTDGNSGGRVLHFYDN